MAEISLGRRISVFLIFVVFMSQVESRSEAQIQNKNNGHPIYQFATRLLNQVAVEKGGDGTQKNILISPFSIRTALAIIYLGAKGTTSEEIQRTLQLPSDRGELVKNLARQIGTTSSSTSSTFNIGNGIFLDKSMSVNETLSEKLKSQLKSTIQTLDFKNDPVSSSSSVNSWISSITKGYINDLVSPSSLSASTFLLANALFYSGQWEKPFSVVPKTQPFKLENGGEIPVTMMRVESAFGYSYLPELKSIGISVPFKDDRFELIILKPDEGQSVTGVRQLLLNYQLEKLTHQLGDNLRTVTLTLPKFTLKANYDIINTMRKMGIVSLFDPNSSNISGLVSQSKSKSSPGRPFVSRMVHQTLLDINEVGATAAAGTIVSGYPISAASTVDIDKPFLFLLNDNLTGPMLIGQLMNPRK